MQTTVIVKKGIVFLVMASALFLGSCKSKQALIQNNATAPSEELKTNEIIGKHYDVKTDFSTIYIKSNVRFDNGSQTQNLAAEIRIKKDEQILVSLRFLGITMAKASITPDKVSYYEKVKGTYFEGDFSGLSQWLGTDLDYNKIQNMLLGESLDDLRKGKYLQTLDALAYQLVDKANNTTHKTFYIDAANFKVRKQQVIQTDKGRKIEIKYGNFTAFDKNMLPKQVHIEAIQEKGKTDINLEYEDINFNQSLSFPYSVPNGYKRIIIN
ncbi:DUF4292 domain-containing protein [Flavobacterium sp. UMI-01]|uniref:DUF4292 domain-containing protein n=1 Tax=Flavobacterium sp. UMI-01 TaxID=1441053 RepID=UPI001C7CB395|nr:DUF4292 domain-containing protein [Flavobacterium sp. UMI-01]GIZ08015.1 hypothetical protein FUMI01_07420 [Flavobacterium sp. UMI-01]